MEKFILVINPGSTSTKLALFRALDNEVEVAVEENVSVPVDLLEQKPHYLDQIDFRLQQVLEFIDKHGVTSDQILCIASRGGPIKPLSAGTYQITKEIEEDIMQERILSPHSSLTAPVVAFRLSQEWGVPAYFTEAVAAKSHFLVERILTDDKIRVKINLLQGQRRIQEVAKMIAGQYVTATTLELASELVSRFSGGEPFGEVYTGD